jgi:alpha-galactosidase/6-phospho-beta-glucosidase family protein
VSSAGIKPVSVGALPAAIAAALSGHCFRQEMIVEAALTANKNLALAALISDPMVQDASTAPDMLTEMMEATAKWLPQFYPHGLKKKTVKRKQDKKTFSQKSPDTAPVPKEISER